MADITLEPGSPSHRIASYLRGAGDITLNRLNIAARLQVAPGAVDSALRPAVDLGLITVANDGDSGRIWRAGPRLKAWQQDMAGTTQPGTPATPKAAAKKAGTETRGGKRSVMPLIDLKSLKVVANAPLPERRICEKGRTRYDGVFDMLTADGMAVKPIDINYMSALLKAAQVYRANRPALAGSSFAVRRIDDTTCGVWRLPRDGATAAPGAAAPTAAARKAAH